MNQLSTAEMMNAVGFMTEIIIANEIPFCELDSAAGDGDFGMSLAKGFKEIKAQWESLLSDDFEVFLRNCGLVITEYCGGASGPIWGSGFRGAARAAKGIRSFGVAEIASILDSAAASIMKTGGAQLGDKTLLDALIPAAESLKESASAGIDLKSALEASAKNAVVGAEKTKNIIATKGRASYLGERSLQFPDAGATAVGIIFTQMVERIFI